LGDSVLVISLAAPSVSVVSKLPKLTFRIYAKCQLRLLLIEHGENTFDAVDAAGRA
jgi:hypothetical protein